MSTQIRDNHDRGIGDSLDHELNHTQKTIVRHLAHIDDHLQHISSIIDRRDRPSRLAGEKLHDWISRIETKCDGDVAACVKAIALATVGAEYPDPVTIVFDGRVYLVDGSDVRLLEDDVTRGDRGSAVDDRGHDSSPMFGAEASSSTADPSIGGARVGPCGSSSSGARRADAGGIPADATQLDAEAVRLIVKALINVGKDGEWAGPPPLLKAGEAERACHALADLLDGKQLWMVKPS